MNDSGYRWGLGSKLRARRDQLGLSQDEMVERMISRSGRSMNRRSWQRMEAGTDAIPDGVWETVDMLHEQMKAEVSAIVEDAEDDPNAEVVHFRINRSTTGWGRQVVARAMEIDPRILPQSIDDVIAEKELTG